MSVVPGPGWILYMYTALTEGGPADRDPEFCFALMGCLNPTGTAFLPEMFSAVSFAFNDRIPAFCSPSNPKLAPVGATWLHFPILTVGILAHRSHHPRGQPPLDLRDLVIGEGHVLVIAHARHRVVTLPQADFVDGHIDHDHPRLYRLPRALRGHPLAPDAGLLGPPFQVPAPHLDRGRGRVLEEIGKFPGELLRNGNLPLRGGPLPLLLPGSIEREIDMPPPPQNILLVFVQPFRLDIP